MAEIRFRDKEYFDNNTYIYLNGVLKEMFKDLGAKTDTPVYILIDKAMREYINNNGFTFDIKPKTLVIREEE